MADKQITIKGLINFDVNQAQRSLNDIGKSFSKLEKTSFNKINDEFRKTKSILKDIDADAGKLFNKLSKKEAQEQLKNINNTLKEQARILKDAVSEQEALADAILKTTNAKEKELLLRKQEQQIQTTRNLMGDIRETAQHRKDILESMPKRAGFIDALKTAGMIQAVGAVAKEVVSHVAGADLRRIGYEAQGQAAPNKIANMIFSKNLDYGILAATGGLKRALEASQTAQTGSTVNRVIGGVTDVATGGVLGSIKGFFGSLFGAGAGAAKAIGENKDIIDPALRKSALTAEKGQLTAEALENLRAKYAFSIDLANERLGLAPAKLAGLQAIAGYEKPGALARKLSGAYSTGWKYGYSIPETSALLQMNSASGLIGAERANIGTMALMERAGLSSPGETSELTRRMGGVVSNQQSVLKMFEQAMTRGVQTGIEKSLVKDLVFAAESLAEGGTARIDNVDNVLKELRTSLSSLNASQIGRQDIIEAQNATNEFRSMKGGGGTVMGMAIQSLAIQEALSGAGIDVQNLSTAALMGLTTAKSVDEIVANKSLMRELTKGAGGNIEKVNRGLTGIGLHKTLGAAMQMEGYSAAEEISSPEGLRQYQQGLLPGASTESRAYSENLRDKLILAYQASRGVTYQQAEKFVNQFGGQAIGLNTEAKIENTAAGTAPFGDVSFGAGVERERETLRGRPEFAKQFSEAMAQQKEAATDFTKKGSPSLFDEGSPLVVQMSRLERAIVDNTNALERRLGGPIPQHPEGYNAPNEITLPERGYNWMRGAVPSFSPQPEELKFPNSGQVKGQ